MASLLVPTCRLKHPPEIHITNNQCPVPRRYMVWVCPPVEATVMLPEVNPTLLGRKVTVNAQLLPGVRLPTQLSVSVKLPCKRFPVKFTVAAFGSLGSLKTVIVIGALTWPTTRFPKFKSAPGDILRVLGILAFNSTGKRPLSISQFAVVLLVHCRVFNSRK